MGEKDASKNVAKSSKNHEKVVQQGIRTNGEEELTRYSRDCLAPRGVFGHLVTIFVLGGQIMYTLLHR